VKAEQVTRPHPDIRREGVPSYSTRHPHLRTGVADDLKARGIAELAKDLHRQRSTIIPAFHGPGGDRAVAGHDVLTARAHAQLDEIDAGIAVARLRIPQLTDRHRRPRWRGPKGQRKGREYAE
jgi:hypothetical protein